MEKRAIDIYNNAMGLSNYKYWYGGKGQIATKALADVLKSDNPTVWTGKYYETSLNDVDGRTRVCDCSGLVCIAYGINHIGSYQIKEKFKVWTGTPKMGMIAWRPGHVGIVGSDGRTLIEMRSQFYDFMASRTISSAGMTHILYSEEVDYDAVQTMGWHYEECGRWYATGYKRGQYAKNEFKEISGRTFFFDTMGYVKTGVFNVGGLTYASTDEGLLCSIGSDVIELAYFKG